MCVFVCVYVRGWHQVPLILLYLKSLTLCIYSFCVDTLTCHNAGVEVRGQLIGASSFLPLLRFWGAGLAACTSPTFIPPAFHIIFETKVLHWTWSSLTWPGWLAIGCRDHLSALIALGHGCMHHAWLFHVGSGIQVWSLCCAVGILQTELFPSHYNSDLNLWVETLLGSLCLQKYLHYDS